LETITTALNFLDGMLGSGAYFPFLLLGTGLFFTIYLKFPQVRYFSQAWRIVRGKYDKPEHEGDASHFQALTTALSGTVGTGNIGGVALAIYLGGPAALFWMWMTAFFGMTTKFVEVSLSHKYRVKDEEGFIAGGPMYFMERALNMKWLAVCFAIATVISSFGTGNMPQSNNMAVGLQTTFGISPMLSGGVLAILLGIVIIGGIKRIVHVTEKIVPLMAVIYFVGAFAVIFANLENIVPSFVSVLADAFSGTAATGGFLGASFAYAFNRGVNRGLFSNEAGQGSAPIAHAAARTDEPVSEGMVSILEPFIDTIVICTITGLVILSSGVWHEKFENDFQQFDTEFISGQFTDEDKEHQQRLFQHFSYDMEEDPIRPLTGKLDIVNGKAITDDFTIIHNRSIAEGVSYWVGDQPYNGELFIEEGVQQNQSVSLRGFSLVHSVALTTRAFTRGLFGEYGQYIVSVGLVLFAFSTAVAWSYYGDRAMTYLFGLASVMPYRIAYIIGFFIAAISDTSLVWLLSAIAIALMTIPNLFGILLLHKDMKNTVADYWSRMNKNEQE
jgi:AGCS family alanine or glycine:cation symporter